MQFSTQTEKINQERLGEVFLISIQKKDLLLLDSFGFTGFKKFIIDNDLSVIDQFLFNLQKFNKKDSKISLVLLTFSIESYQTKKENSLKNLTDTAKRNENSFIR